MGGKRAPEGMSKTLGLGAEFNKAPVLKDGDLVLYESEAILQHLAETRAPGRFLPSTSDAAARATVLQCASGVEDVLILIGFAFAEGTLMTHTSVARAQPR